MVTAYQQNSILGAKLDQSSNIPFMLECQKLYLNIEYRLILISFIGFLSLSLLVQYRLK